MRSICTTGIGKFSFFVNFADGRDDSFTAVEFDALVNEYDLVSFAARPAGLSTLARFESA